MKFGWHWERWDNGRCENGTHVLYLFGRRVWRISPSIFLRNTG